ncbi:hypothetical protein F0562_027250 [Nyssa sinensis]|uniref:Uncharacterized protein n=1 Tax=Nyssa sinensis TaxID=561372 RepID=A0A5J5B708_9ASTE|nr:hypothetical protein F0562_027250 [Nyssa sinensis]
MLTGSVTLKWSAGNLNPISDDFDSLIHDDLDVLVRSLLLFLSVIVLVGFWCFRSDKFPWNFVLLFILRWQEVEEREKAVRHMWDVYTHSSTIRLPRFWQEAFEAAYEDLTSDVPGVRNAAVSEIAKMSLRSVDVEPPPVQPKKTGEKRKITEQAEEDRKVVVTTGGTSS